MQATTVLLLLSVVSLTLAEGYYGGYGGNGAYGGIGGDDGGYAHYKFGYGVQDPYTHDSKSQHEYRDGDHVTGAYTLKDADGTQRIVKYVSGPHSGFEAVVERVGVAHHPARYGHGKHGYDYGGLGGTSYVDVTHWGNQGQKAYGY